jgi:polyribonucleotide nucleotidyltransferase
MMEKVEFQLDGKTVSIETLRLAKQSNGAALVQCAKSTVLVTANSAKPREGIDFFPLTVDYIEKMYAAGKLPGGFFKREGGLGEKEILTSRFIDRALRPLFPDGYRDETQVTATVFGADEEIDTDTLAFLGASAALSLSDIPFPGPIGAVRVGRVDGRFIANPTFEEREAADLDVIVAGSRDALIMVEGGAQEVSEADMLAALRFGHESCIPAIEAQEDLVRRAGKPKREVIPPEPDAALAARIETMALGRIREAAQIEDKKKRYEAFDEIKREVVEELTTEFRERPISIATLGDLEDVQAGAHALAKGVREILGDLRSRVVRDRILDEGVRIDGRATTDIRPITCEVDVLDRVHGSALFTRGETQAFVSVTLAGSRDSASARCGRSAVPTGASAATVRSHTAPSRPCFPRVTSVRTRSAW